MARHPQTFLTRQTMAREDYEIFYYRDRLLPEVPLHHHDFYELYCFLGGQSGYLVEGQLYSLKQGDILLISPQELHRSLARPGDDYTRVVLWINRSFLQALSTEQTPLTPCFTPGRNYFPAAGCDTAPAVQLLLKLWEARNSRERGADLQAEALLRLLLAELVRLTAGKNSGKSLPGSDRLIQEITDYIGEHFREPLSLDSLSERFYLSKYRLAHRFQEQTGTSLYHYVILKRLQQARQLMQEGFSPKEAGQAAGFSDYASFYRAHLKVYGSSPSRG